MSESWGTLPRSRQSERGASSLKFIVILAVVALLGYMGFQYVPVAYKYSSYKEYMQKTVDTAAISGQSVDWVKGQLEGNANDYGVPHEARIIPSVKDGKMTATVQFIRPINLLPGLWTYNYTFDHTVKSTDFFNTK
ncbi:MAG TPA: hypothetical protein VEV81_11445 [Pyrinomonadaceae bacterium]|nr:hypothetical protein [Pyrinomonadaceae bacterium]